MFLNHSVRVHLYYGDADCICNRFGDQTVSIVVNYTHKEDLAAAGCQQFVVSGTEYAKSASLGTFLSSKSMRQDTQPYYQSEITLRCSGEFYYNQTLQMKT
ncbi:hypothetical protein BGZ57DRAFT_522808 [Hyaloscypha finlandica]|nr:hypothetical protein BGZ57DRAFT_522808 [Hyaloscypha finlandica]